MISVVYGSVEVEDGTNGRHDRDVQPSKLQFVELSCASELNRIVLQGVVAYRCCLAVSKAASTKTNILGR